MFAKNMTRKVSGKWTNKPLMKPAQLHSSLIEWTVFLTRCVWVRRPQLNSLSKNKNSSSFPAVLRFQPRLQRNWSLMMSSAEEGLVSVIFWSATYHHRAPTPSSSFDDVNLHSLVTYIYVHIYLHLYISNYFAGNCTRASGSGLIENWCFWWWLTNLDIFILQTVRIVLILVGFIWLFSALWKHYLPLFS